MAELIKYNRELFQSDCVSGKEVALVDELSLKEQQEMQDLNNRLSEVIDNVKHLKKKKRTWKQKAKKPQPDGAQRLKDIQLMCDQWVKEKEDAYIKLQTEACRDLDLKIKIEQLEKDKQELQREVRDYKKQLRAIKEKDLDRQLLEEDIQKLEMRLQKAIAKLQEERVQHKNCQNRVEFLKDETEFYKGALFQIDTDSYGMDPKEFEKYTYEYRRLKDHMSRFVEISRELSDVRKERDMIKEQNRLVEQRLKSVEFAQFKMEQQNYSLRQEIAMYRSRLQEIDVADSDDEDNEFIEEKMTVQELSMQESGYDEMIPSEDSVPNHTCIHDEITKLTHADEALKHTEQTSDDKTEVQDEESTAPKHGFSGHSPAVKVGGMRVVQHKKGRKERSESGGENGLDSELSPNGYGSSPPKTIQLSSSPPKTVFTNHSSSTPMSPTKHSNFQIFSPMKPMPTHDPKPRHSQSSRPIHQPR